jgi:26 proteasome complex subunit DSS1
MSAPPAGGAPNTTGATVSDSKDNKPTAAKPAAQLEEDDEFEDFPIEGTYWP